MHTHEVKLPSLAEYVREQLATGYTALSRVVSSRVGFSAGSLFLIMPDDLVVERVENWNWEPKGMKWRIADRILADHIKAYLRNTANIVLIQDFETKPTDPNFRHDPLRVLHGDEPYWELRGSDISLEKIEECIGAASLWPWLSFFCKARGESARTLTENDLDAAASSLVGVAVQALHDSYVIWWRTDLEPFPGGFQP